MKELFKCFPGILIATAINWLLFHDWIVILGADLLAMLILTIIYNWVWPPIKS